MGLFNSLFSNKDDKGQISSFIDYGKNKADGTHDHRTNKGNDRTPAQKKADKRRTKNKFF